MPLSEATMTFVYLRSNSCSRGARRTIGRIGATRKIMKHARLKIKTRGILVASSESKEHAMLLETVGRTDFTLNLCGQDELLPALHPFLCGNELQHGCFQRCRGKWK
jgi:hypothetical protein